MMFLVVVIHPALIYSPISDMVVKDLDTNFFFAALSGIINIFRMPVFFMIAGFFASMCLAKYGKLFFLRIKGVQLLAPMLFFVPLSQLVNWFIITSTSSSVYHYIFTFNYLWFLYYLFLSCVALVLFARTGLLNLIDKYRGLARISLIILIMALFAVFVDKTIPTPVGGLIVQLSLFFIYNSFFLLGYLEKENPFLRFGKQASISFFLLACIFSLLILLASFFPLTINSPQNPAAEIILRVLNALSRIALCYGIILMAKSMIHKTNTILTLFSKASYTVYLVHMPVLCLLSYLIRDLSSNPFIKFSFVLTLTTVISLLIYRFLVKDRWIELILKGKL